MKYFRTPLAIYYEKLFRFCKQEMCGCCKGRKVDLVKLGYNQSTGHTGNTVRIQWISMRIDDNNRYNQGNIHSID